MGTDEQLRGELAALQAECERLRQENQRLRELLGLRQVSLAKGPVPPALSEKGDITNQSPPEAKVRLFRRLFRGREDVYAVRWEGRNGKVGYSPACVREWRPNRGSDDNGKGPERKLLPLTDQVVHDHLTGRHVIGIYPLLLDETCWFLALDFDKSSWQDDASAFLATCVEWDVPAVLERSRSGRGGHVWIFFESPVSAALARKLGSACLTRTMERRHQLGLDSYDRLFPNQDTMPKGGFGNLIALPLQRGPRSQGNSVFVNDNFEPHPDQWAYLSSLRPMRNEQVEAIVHEAERDGRIIGVRLSLTGDDAEAEPWTQPPSKKKKERPITEPLPDTVRVTRGNLVYVEKAGLPSAMLNRLIRLAAFQNPEFYKAQALRLSTFGKPRIIHCATEFPKHVGLPRGCLAEVADLFKAHGVEVQIQDERLVGRPIEVEFHGELRPLQQQAAGALLAHDDGILSATTAFGKTVVAAWIIATRKVNTLVLVHRRQLMDQWRERLAVFLEVPPKSIGLIGGGRNSPTGILDIGILQSLNRKGVVKDLVADYGQIIADECHHISAFSFEQVLREAKARYVLGLTATPIRKDGHHPIIFMQCGPMRFRVDAREQAAARPFRHVVIPRPTEFRVALEVAKPEIHELYAALVADRGRNDLILADLLAAVRAGRSPLLLTERTEHVNEFAVRLKGVVQHVLILKGGMGAKQRKELADRLAAIPDGEERVLIATGRYIGEGFDDARLDTLFLAMPISWRGTLQHYVGRLHRLHHAKREVQVYDYVDGSVPLFTAMFEKRLKGYEAIGYEVQTSPRVGEATAAPSGDLFTS
ncbi:MAG: restriction endonuclease subunit R [Planctomycetes bacterium]|nr:restriction endonuclease subunit R [Planctomycetota bacterium]